MAYISADEIDIKRKALKTLFPNLKFAVKRDRMSGVIVIIKSGNLDLENLLAGKLTVTRHFIRDMELGIIRTTLTHIYDIIVDGQTYHETSDYGMQPSYYESLRIGEYDKPYKMTV